MELAALIHPYLQDIARQTGETSHLGIVDDGIHIMFIDRALGTSQLKMETALGYRQLAHHTASGKAILGFQSDQVIREYIKRVSFQKLTPASLGDAGELLHLLDQVKRELRLRQRRKRTRPDLFCRPYRRRNRTSCRLHQHFRPDDAHENA